MPPSTPAPLPSPASRTRARRPARVAAALCTALAVTVMAVAACGGGTSQYDPFVPGRIFAFGDEASVLTTDAPAGRNYGINGVDTKGTDDTSDDTLDCALQPNWVQSLAAAYGYVFAECNPNNAEVRAFNRAAPGARVAEVAAQVDAEVAAGGFRDKDLATLMVGVNDIVEIYGLYDGSNEAALVAEAGARGRRAGEIVNRLIALGAKVVVSNIPDLGYTPYAVSENTANPGTDRGGLLSRLSTAFNEQLGVTMLIDGRFVALVQTDQRILLMNRQPGAFILANTTDVACTTPPPACTNNTLVDGATPNTYLWAAPLLLSARGQAEIAVLAVTRAQRNPF